MVGDGNESGVTFHKANPTLVVAVAVPHKFLARVQLHTFRLIVLMTLVDIDYKGLLDDNSQWPLKSFVAEKFGQLRVIE